MKRTYLFVIALCLSLTAFPVCHAEEESSEENSLESSNTIQDEEEEEEEEKAGIENIKPQASDEKKRKEELRDVAEERLNDGETIPALQQETAEWKAQTGQIPSMSNKDLFGVDKLPLLDSLGEKASANDPFFGAKTSTDNIRAISGQAFVDSLTKEGTNSELQFLADTINERANTAKAGIAADWQNIYAPKDKPVDAAIRARNAVKANYNFKAAIEKEQRIIKILKGQK